MERDEVAVVVRKHLIEVLPELKGTDIDLSQSMRDLGANSLDVVEVVSCAMRELKVKVPRSELSKVQDMSGLVDMLWDAANQRAGAHQS